MAQYTHVTPEDIFRNEEVRAYIQQGNDNLGVIGYTEHGFAHAKKSSDTAREILRALGYPQRDCELAAIAGYMHDIGNTVNRVARPQRCFDGFHPAEQAEHAAPGDRTGVLGHWPPR